MFMYELEELEREMLPRQRQEATSIEDRYDDESGLNDVDVEMRIAVTPDA